MGTNVVYVAAGSNRPPGGVREGYGGVKTLTTSTMRMPSCGTFPMIRLAAPAR